MQQNITVTELLNKLKNEKQQYNELDEQESDILVDDTHTEIQQTEQDDLEQVYQEIDDLKEMIDKLTKRLEKLEKNNKEKIYKEKVEFKEVNPMFNKMFDIPESERTYKPVIVKEKLNLEELLKNQKSENNKKSNFRNQSKTRKRSQSKHRKYK